jgi:hypothetical protein
MAGKTTHMLMKIQPVSTILLDSFFVHYDFHQTKCKPLSIGVHHTERVCKSYCKLRQVTSTVTVNFDYCIDYYVDALFSATT